MKKRIAITCLVIAMATLLTACGKFTCEWCGEESKGKEYKTKMGDKNMVLCEDCHDEVESMKKTV